MCRYVRGRCPCCFLDLKNRKIETNAAACAAAGTRSTGRPTLRKNLLCFHQSLHSGCRVTTVSPSVSGIFNTTLITFTQHCVRIDSKNSSLTCCIKRKRGVHTCLYFAHKAIRVYLMRLLNPSEERHRHGIGKAFKEEQTEFIGGSLAE